MTLAAGGRPIVAGAGAVLVALWVLTGWRGGWWWLPAAVWTPLALWVPWFFRDPPRDGPRDARLVIAPADGRIMSVAEEDEPEFISGPAQRVSVFMNVLDVHVNRFPVSGTVAYRRYEPGAFVNATREQASRANERMSVGIRTPYGPVLVRQIAGLIARRIVTHAELGASVSQGERLGMIRFGSRVDTFVPRAARVTARSGERVTAGVTVIAEWPER